MIQRRILELFNGRNPEHDEHLEVLSKMEDLSLPDTREPDPNEDFTMYIGRVRKPHFDIDDPNTLLVPSCSGVCGNVTILHGTKSNTCTWIYVSEKEDKESGWVNMKKERDRFSQCQYRCDTLVERTEVGVFRAADYERFKRIVEEMLAWKGTTLFLGFWRLVLRKGCLGRRLSRVPFLTWGCLTCVF